MKKIPILLTVALLALTAETFNVSTTAEFRTALQNAAMNGEDDTIILADGTYTTTDDGQGTFEYLDNEIYDLTLVGSSSENVILSGAGEDQIFNHQSILSANLKIEKLTFIDGYELDVDGYPINNGGGFESSKAIVTVLDCNFTNNYAKSGGGFYAAYHTVASSNVKNTSFANNRAYVYDVSRYGYSNPQGGGFFIASDVNLTDCNFTNNRAYSGKGGGEGGGFYSSDAIVNHSLFIKNKAGGEGGGFYAGTVKIKDSQFIENSAYSTSTYDDGTIVYNGWGGGFRASGGNSIIENTLFHKNITGQNGGGFYTSDSSTIIKSQFTENKTLNYYVGIGGEGAGFYSGWTTISDSTIKNNHSSSNGGGMHVSQGFIVNSIISGNYAQYKGGAIRAGYRLYMSNSILAHNNSGISLRIGTIEEPSLIINSIFVDTNDSIIESYYDFEDPIVKINNSYLDLDKVVIRNFESNNIFTGVNLGFVNEVNGDYHLTASSDLIDAGTNDFADKFIVDGVNYLEYDYEDSNRSVGASMDIGIYEYSTSKPTIDSFTFSGDPKQYQTITFNVDYTLAEGRSISEVSFDYLNNGTFITEEEHIFSEVKTYPIHTKILDDMGEFSITSLNIPIEELPYDEMTDEEKLKEAIDEAHYADIMRIIEEEKAAAEAVAAKEASATNTTIYH